jgi:Kef-type K+ transport system membrane component KefB
VVLIGLWALGVRLDMALALAGIATATAPATTLDVVNEVSADGDFTKTLLGIVAIDDALGLIAFSLLLGLALAVSGDGGSTAILYAGLREVGGAAVLGVCLGIPMAYLTGRIRPGEPTLAEALGLVFLCGGLAVWLEVSFLLAAMAMGAVVAKLASHHQRPFHAIEHVEWPFMILFFVLAGASLELETLWQVGFIGAVYIVLRIAARIAGVWLGCRVSDAAPKIKHWMAFALLPQAGVALGMALVASQRMPELASEILAVAIGATVFFELVGPVLTRMALVKTGEVNP